MTRLLLLVLTVVALTGCGAADDRAPATAPAPAAPARYLDRHELALQLGNGFRAGLGRLAVMDQPRDDATDVGQTLPTGLLRDVRCAAAGPRPAGRGVDWPWRCRVRWETVAGRPRTTRYAVALRPTGCFGAQATPALRQHYDATINTFAEHPLGAIASVRRGC